MKIETIGLTEFIVRLERHESILMPVLGREMREWAEETMTESKRVVPVGETGNLMNSGHVEGPSRSAGGTDVRLGYGGPAAPYARVVHENLNPGIHWKRPGSGPKYLENPFMERLPQLEGRLRAALAEAAATV